MNLNRKPSIPFGPSFHPHLSSTSLMSLAPSLSWLMPLSLQCVQSSCSLIPWATFTPVLLWYLQQGTFGSYPHSHRVEAIPPGYHPSDLHHHQPQESVLSKRSPKTLPLSSMLVSLSPGLWYHLESYSWHTDGTSGCSFSQGSHCYYWRQCPYPHSPQACGH